MSESSVFWVGPEYWYWKGQAELGSVEHLRNSSTWDVEAGGLGIQSSLASELEANLSYMNNKKGGGEEGAGRTEPRKGSG